jgi:hypothetical protein
MLSLMPLIVVAACTAYAFALLKVVTAMIEAPIGFEDERGFHYGIKVDDQGWDDSGDPGSWSRFAAGPGGGCFSRTQAGFFLRVEREWADKKPVRWLLAVVVFVCFAVMWIVALVTTPRRERYEAQIEEL